MPQETQIPWRASRPALVIQGLALFVTCTAPDAGRSMNACVLASLPFWACSVFLLSWHGDRVPRPGLLFVRWGLLAFVLLGTPVLIHLLGDRLVL